MQPDPSPRRPVFRRSTAPIESRAVFRTGIRFAINTAIFFLAAGCAANADNMIDASLDADFELRAGQSALVSEAMLKVGFIGVTSDSRCGKGEVCFREGDAVVRVWLQKGSQGKDERELHTASNESDVTEYAGYNIRLVALIPARVSGSIIAPEAYIAILRVTESGSGNAP